MTLALVVMTKNEESTLPRLAESLTGLIDCALILDTGSTDSTITVAQEVFPNCMVVETEWVDFSSGRTMALRLAKDMADWSLMLDADMTAEWNPDLKNWLDTEATSDGYMVSIKEANINYRLPLLLRSNKDWRYVGATHEYLDTTAPMGLLNGLTITHHADSSNRTDKHKRDIALLAPGVEAGVGRAIFYTAQAYSCMGEWAKAAGLFDRRAEMYGTWEEERWYAMYQAALCRLHVNPVVGLAQLVEAYRLRPSRAEPLNALATWANLLKPVAPPEGDVLFIEPEAYGD